MDRLMDVVSILFLLSFVVENITFFLRKYFFPKTARHSAAFLRFWYGTETAEESLGEDESPGKVVASSVFIGISMAFLFNVNLLAMLKSSTPSSELFFMGEGTSFLERLSNLPGIMLSGFFLSLGSKLFHDLLDLILQIKNVRKNIATAGGSFANLNTADVVQQLTSSQNIDQYLKTYIQDHLEEIRMWGKIVSVSTFFSEFDGKLINGIKVGLEDNNASGVPATLTIVLPDGNTKNVPIEKEFNLGSPVLTSLRSGDSIRNSLDTSGNFGSVGIPLQDPDTGDVFFCTCYHVINQEGHWQSWRPFKKAEVTIRTLNNEKRGTITLAVLNHLLDVALVQVDQGEKIDTDFWNKGNIKQWRSVHWGDRGKTEVAVRGAKSSVIRKGTVSDSGVAFMNLRYPYGHLHDLFDTIRLQGKKQDGTLGPISDEGDSGALVVASDNKAIGLIVGADNQYSYAIPITNIMAFPYFSHFKIHHQ